MFLLKNFKLTLYLSRESFSTNSNAENEAEYQLSADIHPHKAGTKLPDESALYLVGPRFFFKSTIFGYVQPW